MNPHNTPPTSTTDPQPVTLSQNLPADPTAIRAAIEQELAHAPNEFSVIAVIDLIVAYANSLRASDIHIDPNALNLRIRFRIDGILYEVFRLPKILQSMLVSRVKILCGLRTDEHQVPQDGRFKTAFKSLGSIDVRVSIIPTYYGENIEMRLLQTPENSVSLASLGLSAADLTKIEHAMSRPYGMILATGPTGSGKTTMLYTILRTLNKPEVAIMTIEDPIEYSIEGITQIQTNASVGLTFAAGLRSFLRQDPNVIMVGEIRDAETAEIAVNAALTGHLLLSTLHTNDAATTLARLIEFKTEPFLVASTVNLAIGQRLVRKICSYCRIEKTLGDAEYEALTASISVDLLNNYRNYFVGKGCDQCGGSGYSGRVGIYEVLVVDEPIRELIMRRATANELATLAVARGMTTMLYDGLQKAMNGLTTLEEVLRVVRE